MITVRPATADDAALLLDWANDPATRAAGFHRDAIDAATHRRWLAARLASRTSRLYVGLADERPIGQVRLEGGPDGRVEVGISVAPEARGRGAGHDLLRAGLDAGRADPDLRASVFVARIRPDNGASIALFTGSGFLFIGSEDVNGDEALVYELPAG
jgi:UDP-2,4-diacetamido-2,4,6-trideoxy-beta-L-altropyranose hydrolase